MQAPLRMMLVVAVALLLAPARVAAQAPMGSVMVSGAADSLFTAFLTHLRAKGHEIEAQDSVRRTVRFLVAAANGEATNARFSARRDSTLIEAQGARGGMLALLVGLNTVREMLAARDSTKTQPPETTPIARDP